MASWLEINHPTPPPIYIPTYRWPFHLNQSPNQANAPLTVQRRSEDQGSSSQWYQSDSALGSGDDGGYEVDRMARVVENYYEKLEGNIRAITEKFRKEMMEDFQKLKEKWRAEREEAKAAMVVANKKKEKAMVVGKRKKKLTTKRKKRRKAEMEVGDQKRRKTKRTEMTNVTGERKKKKKRREVAMVIENRKKKKKKELKRKEQKEKGVPGGSRGGWLKSLPEQETTATQPSTSKQGVTSIGGQREEGEPSRLRRRREGGWSMAGG